ncbi:efflux transporter outer membrane subunit [Paraburkholderia acidisoli]|uniref:Efflux transporter outer membrane subunit n=1 Tax=Paraburkholderia acidisoli TaxID=2571748 RepID=A0A7Z2GPQ9_9BURK|nr:efflux transporter outer membrane subunit [Paraburkholderia acidisoli]QGZ65670.1 efflux transporter outer membrane subunit [Paraburkholderia acidisoli]
MSPLRFPTCPRRALVVALGAALTACSSAPAYRPPSVDVPAHYAGAGTGTEATPATSWTAAAPAADAPRGAWWRVFGDTQLNALEARVDVSNQSVRKALADLDAARAMTDFQRAGLLPTLTAGAAQSRYRTSANKQGASLAGKTVPDYAIGATATWEPDVFGRLRDEVDSARANAQASAADLEAVRLAVTAQLAADYFDLRSLDAQKRLLDDSVRGYASALRIVQNQQRNGAIDASAVAQAQTQLDSTRTQARDIDVNRAQLEHAIATLTGEPASNFSLPPAPADYRVPAIPAGLPSQLMERRPDIAAAQRRVAAANAEIGAARAAFFPNLVLSASAGLESSFFAPWLSAPSLFWSLGPQLVGTLFDGGKRSATLRAKTAQYDGTVAQYRQTVLGAFEQVENQLSALQALADESATQQRAAQAAQQALSLTTRRYDAGAVSYLDVVTSQTIALTNERDAVVIEGRRMAACVRLIEALGGTWDAPESKNE